jgi:hypothetical protein
LQGKKRLEAVHASPVFGSLRAASHERSHQWATKCSFVSGKASRSHGRSSTVARRKGASRPIIAPRSDVGSAIIGPYGLTRVDYSKPPPLWPIPPPPPASHFETRYYPALVAALIVGAIGYLVMNRDQNVYEYWRLVEQGNVPLDDDDEDDDDDDDEQQQK